ncbi:hypothetical protein SAMN04488134_10825 [Amphibacillus marinus]|uniref:Uncharacterized protein n=1 Tax=Amphibacillus marinus TaxID=872970 RepID=A0A1H8Q3R1_9BACI|nr:hypothetical protein [Amphibacillus marinus]SEO48611.1 hypothetical protein SAMN04488134_10825 [Amphibacillus marinus]
MSQEKEKWSEKREEETKKVKPRPKKNFEEFAAEEPMTPVELDRNIIPKKC